MENSEIFESYHSVLTVLDRLEVGVCIAEQDATVIVKNSAARKIVSFSNELSFSKNRLRLANHRVDKLLKQRIRNSFLAEDLSARTDNDNHTEDQKWQQDIIVTARDCNHSELIIEISPIRLSQDRKHTSVVSGHALIMIMDASHRITLSADRLAQIHRLTDTESVICQLLLDGKTTREMAHLRGVSTETIKSQVKSVMSKTNSIRRTDLIRLVTAYAPLI